MKDKKATILIDLNQSEEEIYDKFSKDLRWGIRRAQKEGLYLKERYSDVSWMVFKRMFRETWWSVSPKLDEMVVQWRMDRSRRLFFVMKPEEEVTDAIVGYAIVKDMSDRLNMEYLSYAHKDFIKWRVNDIIHWELIKLAKQEKKSYFDVGGYQLGAKGKTDKVNKYKEQFNGELVITEVKGNFFYILGRKIVRRFPWITLMRKKMRGYKFNE